MSKRETENKDLILRDRLAIDRTRMANQRTLLSFIRTGIYFAATALAIFHLEKRSHFTFIEWTLCSIGVFLALTGIINYLFMRRKIRKGQI
ncbi:MAG: DUF202 domain-containing protein [Bacteroidetes bacterium]|nr:DUF202 domain-containing protein [Bacteroidota bacterium]